jgi:hypothetical protein
MEVGREGTERHVSLSHATSASCCCWCWCRSGGSPAILAGMGGRGEEEALLRQAHLVQQARDSGGSADRPAKKRQKGSRAAGGESPPPVASPDGPDGMHLSNTVCSSLAKRRSRRHPLLCRSA